MNNIYIYIYIYLCVVLIACKNVAFLSSLALSFTVVLVCMQAADRQIDCGMGVGLCLLNQKLVKVWLEALVGWCSVVLFCFRCLQCVGTSYVALASAVCG